ncbi:hypothetical protein CKO16_09380 [Rhodoblastus acidophilus]|uniref:hypothetical protein n=1 Tax=Rhodoblastus acidophilus TaxID=1074 RepID=UPI000CECC41E|nr:hypothetical protein [Rhodoblastus acidophilus]PPQ38810.1 hypothetical protein CKO16_09380 [Rhodoblastus acidophilus]
MSALAQNSDAQRFSFVAPSPSYGSSYATRTVVIDTPGPQLGAGAPPAPNCGPGVSITTVRVA